MTTDQLISLIYSIGGGICYILSRTYVYQERSWIDILYSLFLTMFSWISVLLILYTYSDNIRNKYKINKNKPPKWL